MHILWGSLRMAVGLFMLVCASLKSEFILYRLLCARSRIMWGEHVHRFYLISGTMVIVFGGWATLGPGSEKKEPRAVQDYNSVRAELRSQVDQGKLTKEEAIVQLAEAQAKLGARQRKKEWKPSPELQALGKELTAKVEEGHMTAEEAKAEWMEAAGKAKSGARAKKRGDSTEVKK